MKHDILKYIKMFAIMDAERYFLWDEKFMMAKKSFDGGKTNSW